ncbi:MAG: hypothetical protein U0Q16_10220 [Bryobacteraceae bacterium]
MEYLFLRRTLVASAWFSAISGVLVAAEARLSAALLGIGSPVPLLAAGLGVTAYAILIARDSAQSGYARSWDSGSQWRPGVGGSVALIEVGIFPAPGAWAVAAVASVGLAFAAAEGYGLRTAR